MFLKPDVKSLAFLFVTGLTYIRSIRNKTMIKLNPDSTTNEIKTYLRNDSYQRSVLVEEQTNTETEVVFNVVSEQKHHILSTGALPLKEGYFYILKSYDASGLLIQKEKLFATSQTDNYSVNEGAYKIAESTDDKIILG